MKLHGYGGTGSEAGSRKGDDRISLFLPLAEQ